MKDGQYIFIGMACILVAYIWNKTDAPKPASPTIPGTATPSNPAGLSTFQNWWNLNTTMLEA